MRSTAVQPRSASRQVALGCAAFALVILPDAFFSVISTAPWEVMTLRMTGMVTVLLLAGWSWAAQVGGSVLRRLRRWSIPGVAATTVFLVSTDPTYLLIGFCLLTGAALDLWATRGHIASESLHTRLGPDRRRHR